MRYRLCRALVILTLLSVLPCVGQVHAASGERCASGCTVTGSQRVSRLRAWWGSPLPPNSIENRPRTTPFPRGRVYQGDRYFGNFNNRYYGPQYGYF